MEISVLHSLFLTCASVSIDTRKIDDNCMFFALKGERFDANAFAIEALEKGAAYVIIDNKNYFVDHRTVLVQNSLETLQELAQYHRNYLGLPIISLTGSNGKTTTKELIYAVLSKKYRIKATIGNLNNHIGVPLTLLSFTEETEIGIVEMGANHQKEIAFLCDLTKPDFGYITNFGKAHLEGFGGVEGVIKGKSELYDYLKSNEKVAFVNFDDAIQVERTEDLQRFGFSQKKSSGIVFVSEVSANPFVQMRINDVEVKSHLIGDYNANNIAAAFTIGSYFAVESGQMKEAIEAYESNNNRSQVIQKTGLKIILDAYNANPSSMEAAIYNFERLSDARKVMILGDMFELGVESIEEHKAIVQLVADLDFDVVYFIGHDFYANKIIKKNLLFFEDYNQFVKAFKVDSVQDSVLLIKGSRGMALERLLEVL